MGFRVLCRDGNLTIVTLSEAKDPCSLFAAPKLFAFSQNACLTYAPIFWDTTLDLRPLLHEAHARQNLGSLLHLLQIVSSKVRAS